MSISNQFNKPNLAANFVSAKSQLSKLSPLPKEDQKQSSSLKQKQEPTNDQLKVKNGKAGGSLPRFSDLEAEKAAWDSAALGNQVPEIQFRVQQGVDAPSAIYDHLDRNGNLSPEEFDRVADFMQEVMSHGKVDSTNPRYDQMDLKDVLNEGVAEYGITDEQIDLIVSGDFSAEAYISMVNDGRPIA